MKKEIKLFGETITIAYNLAVELAFEDIAGKPIIGQTEIDGKPSPSFNIVSKRDQVALFMSAIIANNPDSPLVAADASAALFSRLTTEATRDELTELDTAIGACMSDWYHLPELVAKAQAKAQQKARKGPKGKNS